MDVFVHINELRRYNVEHLRVGMMLGMRVAGRGCEVHESDGHEGDGDAGDGEEEEEEEEGQRPSRVRRASGAVGLSTWGGGGGQQSPPKLGGGESGKRAQLTSPLISYYKLWRQRCQKFLCALKMVKFFSTKYMANDDFSETPRRADSKNRIFFFLPFFRSGSPPRPGVQSR